MSVKNVYPEKPEIPYKKTSVPMADVIAYLQSLELVAAVKIAAYIMFRNESANGKSGVNNNYAGIQADNSRWAEKFDKKIVGTSVKVENMTGKERRFAAFDSWKTSVDFLIDRVISRGLYVGGYAQKIAKMQVQDTAGFARAYYKEWVTGNKNAEPDADTLAGIKSMYRQGADLFK